MNWNNVEESPIEQWRHYFQYPLSSPNANTQSTSVKFKSYTEQYIDSLGVFGEAIIGVLAAVAAQERIRISERTKAGLARTRAQGTRLGRPKAEVDLLTLRRLRDRGETMRSIAKKLRVSPALVCLKLKKMGR